MSTNPQITNRQGDVIDAPELTLSEAVRALAHLNRQPFRDALTVALRNPTDAVPVVGPAWYHDERFRDAIDLCITLRIKNATVLSDALFKWSHDVEFCTACQQHRPCSCDDAAGDR